MKDVEDIEMTLTEDMEQANIMSEQVAISDSHHSEVVMYQKLDTAALTTPKKNTRASQRSKEGAMSVSDPSSPQKEKSA